MYRMSGLGQAEQEAAVAIEQVRFAACARQEFGTHQPSQWPGCTAYIPLWCYMAGHKERAKHTALHSCNNITDIPGTLADGL